MVVRPFLPLARYRLKFIARERVRLPSYSGSAWRGAFGHAFKRAVCATGLPDCRQCLLYRCCSYAYVFETPPPLDAKKMRKYTAAPHPFVLDLEARTDGVAAGDPAEVGLVLVGKANAYLPYLVLAMARAAERGIGKGRGKLDLIEVMQEERLGGEDWRTIYERNGAVQPLPIVSPEVPSVAERLRLVFHTPLRLKRDGRLVSAGDLRFSDLFSSLLRRVSMLAHFHSESMFDADFRALSAAARQIDFASAELAWRDWTRYSSRQESTMQLGGIVGEVVLPSDGLAHFWPYLWIGQYVHAGHGTSMGLGRYSVHPASLRARQQHSASFMIGL